MSDGAGGLTHLDASGTARMVDVGEKPATQRVAIARSVVRVSPETAARVHAGDTKKGEREDRPGAPSPGPARGGTPGRRRGS